MYPEYDVQADLLGENAAIKAQTRELEDQIAILESEQIRLRRALKMQAGAVGEQGFKYAGLSAEQLVLVNEYAAKVDISAS